MQDSVITGVPATLGTVACTGQLMRLIVDRTRDVAERLNRLADRNEFVASG